MKSILITGCNGLLGFELISQLKEFNEFKVFGLSMSELNHSDDNFTHIKADLSSCDFISSLPVQIDCIIHLAQSNEFRNFPEKGMDIFNVNVQSTQLLLDYAVKASCQKFIFTSTGGVYSGKGSPYAETFEISSKNNLGYYATSKLIAEQLICSYQGQFNHLIFRPFFIYGSRQKNDMLIPRLINNIKNDTALNVDGALGLSINPIHVQDASKAIISSISDKWHINGLYNLGGNEILSLGEIGKLIASKLNKNCTLNSNLSKEPQDVCGNTSKLNEDLYVPTISLSEGLNEMIHEK